MASLVTSGWMWGSIRPGDLLVTSGTRGHAMRDDSPPVGTVIGKATRIEATHQVEFFPAVAGG